MRKEEKKLTTSRYVTGIAGSFTIALLTVMITATAHADGRQIFLKGDDLNQAVDVVLQRALADCPPPAITYGDPLAPPSVDGECLSSSVMRQATPDSVRQMVSAAVNRDSVVLAQECRRETNQQRRQVVCTAQKIVEAEHSRRVHAYGALVERGRPLWK